MNFVEKLLAASRQQESLLCVGLDPEPGRLPQSLRQEPVVSAIVRFCKEIIAATAPYACAFKPNLAFFEVLGPAGLQAFQEVVQAVPTHIPVIADAKRGDIGNTARAYAKTFFETYGCDAVTVNPYMGYDSVAPFLEYRDKGTLLLCRTSNPGAGDIQDLRVQDESGTLRPLYEVVAQRVQSWDSAGNCGLVVGATYPEEMRQIRKICPQVPILIPGVGAQGGDLEAAAQAGVDAQGERAILSSSRAILYSSAGEDFAQAAANEARRTRDQINAAHKQQG